MPQGCQTTRWQWRARRSLQWHLSGVDRNEAKWISSGPCLQWQTSDVVGCSEVWRSLVLLPSALEPSWVGIGWFVAVGNKGKQWSIKAGLLPKLITSYVLSLRSWCSSPFRRFFGLDPRLTRLCTEAAKDLHVLHGLGWGGVDRENWQDLGTKLSETISLNSSYSLAMTTLVAKVDICKMNSLRFSCPMASLNARVDHNFGIWVWLRCT